MLLPTEGTLDNSCLREHGVASEAGMSKLTFLVFALIIGAAIYTGYRVLPFYYYFYELRNQMEAAVRVASEENDEGIRKKLVYHIRKMDLPVGSDDELRDALKIERDGGRMRISLPYEEVYDVDVNGKNYVLYRFKFHAYVDKAY